MPLDPTLGRPRRAGDGGAHLTARTNRFWTQRTFGVEMEMKTEARSATGRGRVSLSGMQINSALSQRCTMPVTGAGNYYQSTQSGRAWEVKYDSSAGYEVVTPALRLDNDGKCAELERGCYALASLRPLVDRSCGLHVHVDCSDFSWQDMQKLLALWMRYEPFFYEMLPASRHANTYCQPMRGASWDRANQRDASPSDYSYQAVAATTREQFQRAGQGTGKYRSLNISGWWTHGRVEFRLHSATIEYEKIRKWVIMLVTMCSRVKAGTDIAPRLSKKPSAGRGAHDAAYVLRMIGLGPCRWNEETAVYREVLAFTIERRRKFGHAPHAHREDPGALAVTTAEGEE